MHIDWFTMIAQIVNFLILMVLLQRVLFKPVLRHMEEREQTIEKQLRDADDQKAQAEREAQDYRQKQQDLEKQKQQLIDESKQAVEKQKQDMTERARQEVNHLQLQWIRSIREEQDDFIRQLQDTLTKQVFDTCNRVLGDLASSDLDRQMVTRFLEQYRQQPEQQQHAFEDFLRQTKQAVVETHDRLPDDQRRELEKSILHGIRITYRESEELLGGIVIRAGGKKLSWTVRDYLQGIRETVKQELEQAIPHPEAATATEKSEAPPEQQQAVQQEGREAPLKKREADRSPENRVPETREIQAQASQLKGRPASERSQPEAIPPLQKAGRE